jgi:hypothetical protein
MLIESLPDERFDNGLAAYVKIPGRPIQFLQHGGREVHIHALNWLNHAARALEETRNILPLIG